MKPPAELLNIACPTQSELVDLSVGKLDESRIATVARHVGHCSRCQDFVQTYHDTSDSVVGLIRGDTEPVFEPGEVSQVRNEMLAEGPLPGPAGDEAALRPFPRKFGPYELKEFVGQGGMGTVYSARHTKLQRAVVIKFLSPQRLADAESIGRFHREMEVLGKFADPHIIFAHDAGEVEGHFYLVMEAVDGIDLRRLLLEGGPLPVREACELARQAAAGLGAAHELRVVHRDVKPSNLLVSNTGQVKVLDLGLATLVSDSRPGDRSGTADYMAPEQWSGQAVDPRTDIYGLGCTLFKLLTGKAPFQVDSASATERMQAHLEAKAPSLEAFREDVPAGLNELVQRMLAKSPDQRFFSMADVEEALCPFAAGANLPELVRGRGAAAIRTDSDAHRSTFIVRPELLAPQPRPARRFRRPLAVGAALALFAVAASLSIPWSAPVSQSNLLERAYAPFVNHQVSDLATLVRVSEGSDELASWSDNMGAWSFDEAPQGPFGLQVELTSTWSGWTGVFFGGYPSPERPSQWRLQGIDFHPSQDRKVLNIYWAKGDLGLNDRGDTSHFAWEAVPMPEPGHSGTLGLLFNDQGLLRVYWNGRELKELVRSGEPERPYCPPGGLFGLMQGIGTSRFHRFTLLQGNEGNLHAALNYNASRTSGL
jgi:serine/threonine protein kinase